MQTCTNACTPSCRLSGRVKEAQRSVCSLRQRGRGGEGAGSQFLPAGSYLTSGIICQPTGPATQPRSQISHPYPHLWHNFNPIYVATQNSFYNMFFLFVCLLLLIFNAEKEGKTSQDYTFYTCALASLCKWHLSQKQVNRSEQFYHQQWIE